MDGDVNMLTILQGDCREQLKALADESAQCVVTSPPYYGLRSYGTEPVIWGGEEGCTHEWASAGATRAKPDRSTGDHDDNGSGIFVDRIARRAQPAKAARGQSLKRGDFCECGAWRGELGLEPNPRMYVDHLVEIFQEVHRVLRSDGALFLNIGDSYANDAKWGGRTGGKHVKGLHGGSGLGREKKSTGFKPKCLMMIPARVVIALCDDGWTLRSEIVWHKLAPIPESVKDRPTRAHEMVYMLTKGPRYFYNYTETRDPLKQTSIARLTQSGYDEQAGSERANGGAKTNGNMKAVAAHFGGRNKSQVNDQTRLASGNEWHQDPQAGANWRDVWSIAHEGFDGAHFATMPLELAERCIIAGSSARDVTLDPFAGSGTTGEAALKLGRRAVLIEAKAENIQLIRKRCAITPNLLLAAAGD